MSVAAPGDDPYLDAGIVSRSIVSATGGNFESLLIDPAAATTAVTDTVGTTTVSLSASATVAEGGSIVVRTCPESPDSFRLEVEDSGIGIAPEQIQRLFVEVEQIGAGARKPPSSGLGLVLTRRIVEAQGGTVGVRSRPGQGSVFHAVLPRETAAIPAR